MDEIITTPHNIIKCLDCDFYRLATDIDEAKLIAHQHLSHIKCAMHEVALLEGKTVHLK